MNNNKRLLLLLLLLSISSSSIITCCSVLFSDEKLSIPRTDYKGNQLRVDGYYYRHDDTNNTLVLFPYRNGVMLFTRAFPSVDLSIVENEMIGEYSAIRKEKTRWGVFTIMEKKIVYERWTSPTELVSVKKGTGYIENDTTFLITENYFSYNGKKYPVNEVWHFKPFSNKPDSTNNFIK